MLEQDIYRETASGASKRRPQFKAMLADLRPGDVVTVWKLDRLSRSVSALLHTVEFLRQRGAFLRVITQQIDTSTASGRMFLQMLGVIAEFERELGRERTRAGLAAARQNGRVGGRPMTFTDEQIREAVEMKMRGATWGAAARSIGISVPRLQARARALQEKDGCQTN